MNKTNKLSKEDRSQICQEVFFFMCSLERLQRMPLEWRLLYYMLAYKVYDILRKNKMSRGWFRPADDGGNQKLFE